MFSEIPQYGLKAYALFFAKHGTRESFRQSELDWIVSQSMKKKIFALLLKAGWIRKKSKTTYRCVEPETVMNGLLEFKVPEMMKSAKMTYAFTGASAVEIWSDYSYVQRGIERSPYFIKVLKKDLKRWKEFFNEKNIPNYVDKGSTIGEFVILMPVKEIAAAEKENLKVETLGKTIELAKSNDIYLYACDYMRKKYGPAAA